MKEILLGKKEDRLEILRKVFGIDKYKRVRDNSEIFITSIKQKSKEIAAQIADLEQKSEELSERKQRHEELKTISLQITPELEKAQILVNEKKKGIEILELKLKEFEQIKLEKEKTRINLEHKEKELENTKENLSKLNPELMRLEEELKNTPLSNPSLKDRIPILEAEIKKHEEQNIFSERKKAELETQRKTHEKLSNDINSLDHCPICKQDVDEDHKHKITSEETSKIQKLVLELDAIKRSLQQNQETLSAKKEELQKLQSSLNNQELIQLKQRNLESKKTELSTITSKLEELKTEIINLKNKNLETENNTDNQLEQQLSSQKGELELLSANLKDIEIKKASTDSELKTLEDILQRLEQEVLSKEKAKNNISKLMQLREWIEKQFIGMTQLMEKNIMLRVHAELESLIQKWFSMLADSETIKIKIDEEFTPIIEQNGHETEYTHLSGGEKTAAALSYRLALNQVINTLMTTINTKNILMLDEPTDGFSQEQLERMRNILEELNTKQTIIVSHDPKVESFVDNVIRLEKNEHITSITNC
jgi:exonuclease SbcC